MIQRPGEGIRRALDLARKQVGENQGLVNAANCRTLNKADPIFQSCPFAEQTFISSVYALLQHKPQLRS